MKKTVILFSLLVFTFGCSKKANLTIGKKLDKKNLVVSDITKVFTAKDNVSFVLFNNKKFETTKLILQIYKFTEKSAEEMKRNYILDINPESDKIANSIPANKLKRLYGKGEFKFVFILKEKVIASGKFAIE